MGTPHSLLIAAALMAAATPVPAEACTVPTKPFDPAEFRSGVILEGAIQSSEREGRMISVTLKVEKVHQGQFRADEYVFSFFPAESSGECLPASTQIVPTGQRLVVYLEQRDAGLWRKGWMHFDEAAQRDYRVRVPPAQQR
jgi:hypothetical protein